MRLDRPITKAEMLLESKDPALLTLSDHGQAVELAASADASSSYRFRFTWQLNGRSYVDEGPKNFLRVVPDLDPRAELTYPLEDEKATLDKTLTLAFRAQDDYSLENAWIVYAINDGAEQWRPAVSLGGVAAIEKELTWSIKSDNPGLKEGDILTFAIEVSDGRAVLPATAPGLIVSHPAAGSATTPATTMPAASIAHVARTKSRRVQFVSAKEYLEYALNRQRKYLGQIRPLYLQERDAAAHVRELEIPATEPAPVPATMPALPVTMGKDAHL
jgi:hypothetical protein